jgi:hypothetical protein
VALTGSNSCDYLSAVKSRVASPSVTLVLSHNLIGLLCIHIQDQGTEKLIVHSPDCTQIFALAGLQHHVGLLAQSTASRRTLVALCQAAGAHEYQTWSGEVVAFLVPDHAICQVFLSMATFL